MWQPKEICWTFFDKIQFCVCTTCYLVFCFLLWRM